MREILFRGKCKETGKWYTGYYINLHKTTYCFKEDYDHYKDNDIHQIVFEEMTDWGLPNQHLRVDVIPETIGQYTGLTDKNGKKIFEGDIVEGHCHSQWSHRLQRCVVVYDRDGFKSRHYLNYPDDKHYFEYKVLFSKDVVVVGNIHDNPELLRSDNQCEYE